MQRIQMKDLPTAYDPLISKLVAWAPDRAAAIARMVRALTEYDVRGIHTTIAFCRDLIGSPEFAAADFDTTYVDRLLDASGAKGARNDELEEVAAVGAAMWEMRRAGLKASTTADMADTAGKADTAHMPDAPATAGATQAAGATGPRPAATTFTAAKPADSLWAQRARWESVR
jgi:acetyl/propionyl-CoA carboxylase alpha subunit